MSHFPTWVLLGALSLVSMGASAGGSMENRLMEQLTQFNGGCPPRECIDVQFVVHRAPMCINGPNVNANTYSHSMVRKFPTDGGAPPLAGGSSTLVRAGDGVSFDIITTGLTPWWPYTIWWVAFNPDNPCVGSTSGQDCTCTGADLRPGLDSVFWAAGATADRLGTATFAGHTDYGVMPDGEDQVVIDGPGIVKGAEIHFVVRSHGRRIVPPKKH